MEPIFSLSVILLSCFRLALVGKLIVNKKNRFICSSHSYFPKLGLNMRFFLCKLLPELDRAAPIEDRRLHLQHKITFLMNENGNNRMWQIINHIQNPKKSTHHNACLSPQNAKSYQHASLVLLSPPSSSLTLCHRKSKYFLPLC